VLVVHVHCDTRIAHVFGAHRVFVNINCHIHFKAVCPRSACGKLSHDKSSENTNFCSVTVSTTCFGLAGHHQVQHKNAIHMYTVYMAFTCMELTFYLTF
jgi:hypothetical protein